MRLGGASCRVGCKFSRLLVPCCAHNTRSLAPHLLCACSSVSSSLTTATSSVVADYSPSALFAAGAPQEQSRAAFLSHAGAAVFTAFAVVGAAAQPAAAAQYGSFGAGTSPLVLNPADAEIDAQVLQSPKVQAALQKVRTTYQPAVARMQAALAADPQSNVRATLTKELDAAGLRDALNTINAAFEEDTQRGTDRLIRVILQDITELDMANTQKEGVARSPRRVEIMNGKLSKLAQAFDDYLAFAK